MSKSPEKAKAAATAAGVAGPQAAQAAAPGAAEAAAFSWSASNMACVATYSILELNDRLDQFDAQLLPFEAAGATKLSSLPYYGAGLLSPGDLAGRVKLMTRKFILFVLNNYTNRKENPADSIVKLQADIEALFKNEAATISMLAAVTDAFFKFSNEA